MLVFKNDSIKRPLDSLFITWLSVKYMYIVHVLNSPTTFVKLL